MRTKTLVLIAAVALAAGILTSSAQTYSQNVVGYANVVTPNGGTYLVTVPFKEGVSNFANEVWPLVGGLPTIPDYSSILIWNGTGYDVYISDSTPPSLWDDSGYGNLPSPPTINVGQGFFIIPSGTWNWMVGLSN